MPPKHWNDTKLIRVRGPGVFTLVLGIIVAMAIGSSALRLAPPLTGYLHPGLLPGLLSAMLLAAATIVALESGERLHDFEPWRPGAIACMSAATLIMAFGSRPGGVFLSSFASAVIAAFGVTGMTARKAAYIGLGLSIATSFIFAIAQRQPLPILPPGLFW